ncbi:MAG TPA: hypothetical protein EYN67_18605 [Flavobacteriales bacterium]|nr:hypothetical protein [Flavobacteriales bacterium]
MYSIVEIWTFVETSLSHDHNNGSNMLFLDDG